MEDRWMKWSCHHPKLSYSLVVESGTRLPEGPCWWQEITFTILLLWTVKGICPFLCLRVIAIWERYKLQGLTSESGIQTKLPLWKHSCSKRQKSQERRWRAPQESLGLLVLADAWRRASSAVETLLATGTGYFHALNLEESLQKIQILKASWAGSQRGLVVRSFQNYILSITCWEKLKWIWAAELTGQTLKWQLQSGLKTKNCINFHCQ